jgi:3-keto-disaccharide hydrolase
MMRTQMMGFVIIGLLAGTAVAQTERDKNVLFNGKDLSGWTYHLDKPDVKMEDVWSVKDGMLVCKGRPAGYLLTKKKDFENYVLTLEWRWPEKGGNNGVLVHVTKPGELGVWPKSLEVQLASGEAGDFWVIGTTIKVDKPEGRIEGRRHKNLSDGDEKPIGEWNKYEITCRGDEVLVKVNGKLVNHATKVSQTKGAIALQSEGTPIEFRNIKLRPLEKEKKPAT